MASILSDPFTVAHILILLLEMVIGISSTIFVITVIVNESQREKSMNAGNKIRIALYISNVCYSITVFAGVISGFLGPNNGQITDSPSAYVVGSLNMFAMSSSSWLTAVLSLFYFFKIVDFKSRVIVWAKKNINEVIPWMIAGVEVSAFLSSFLGMLLLKNNHSLSINNSTLGFNILTPNFASGFLSIALFVSSVPFLIIVITCSCIAKTLTNHRRCMVENMVSSTNDNTKSYGKLVSNLTRLVINYMVYYLFVLLYYVASLFQMKVAFWVFLLLISSFGSLLSIQLIIANPKFRKKAKEMLSCTLCLQKTK